MRRGDAGLEAGRANRPVCHGSCGRQQGLSWARKNGNRVSSGGDENVQELDNGGQLYSLVNVGKITDLHN